LFFISTFYIYNSLGAIVQLSVYIRFKPGVQGRDKGRRQSASVLHLENVVWRLPH